MITKPISLSGIMLLIREAGSMSSEHERQLNYAILLANVNRDAEIAIWWQKLGDGYSVLI